MFAQYSGETGRLTKISGQLKGGCIAHVDSSWAVYLPPGWLHATFTTRPGNLVGINFVSLESLEIMVVNVAIQLPYLYRICQEVLEDFGEYSKAVLFFLDDEYESQIITTVLKSWVLFLNSLSKAALQHTDFQSAVLALLDGLEKGLSQKEACCCDVTYKNVLSHVKHKHWISDM